MSRFQPIKTQTMIILQVILEIVLDEVYGVIVNVFYLIVICFVEIYTSLMMYG